jgi:L-alanine-DL-glutamate epimerase-like enolase superfamily enzyme
MQNGGCSLLKITNARAYLCDLPVARERVDAVQSFLKQETVFVEVETDEGVSGLGYAYTIGTGGRAVLELLGSYLLQRLVGEDAQRPEAIWKKLFSATRATMVGPITALALAAVDIAVWDLRCRRLGVPLWQLAGGAQERVPLYDTEGGWLQLTLDELAANSAAAVGRGLKGVKIKVGKPTASEDFARVKAVRESIGQDVALMVDANQVFTRDEALRRAKMLEPLDVAWFEEPLPADDVQGHAQLADRTGIPVAVGESLYSISQFREYLNNGAANIVQVDVARIGGISPWLKVAHLAEAFDVPVAPHFLMEIHVNLSAAVANGRWVEWIPQLGVVTTAPIEVADGKAIPSNAPGVGIAWDRQALERFRIAEHVLRP